jgi:type VI secretion system protein ImpH
MLAEKAEGRTAALPKKLRFRTPAFLGFAPSEITRFSTFSGAGETTSEATSRVDSDSVTGSATAEAVEDVPQEMEVGFMGLTGPTGVLPQHYTEMLMDRKYVFRDTAAHAFFDLFNHRVVSLFYAAWQKYRFYVGYEQGAREGFTRHILDMLATSRPNLQGDTALEREAGMPKERPVTPQALAFFAGALGKRPVPSSVLESLVSTYFGVKVKLEQFVGQWIDTTSDESDTTSGKDFALGVSTMLGQRIWDQQTKIRLRIGPLNYEQFREFQPGQKATLALRQLVETCVGQSLNCDVTLILDRRAASDPDTPMPMSLGLTTWVRTMPPEQDLDDVQYKLL